MYRKSTVFSFADYYLRNYNSGMTMEECFKAYLKNRRNPRQLKTLPEIKEDMDITILNRVAVEVCEEYAQPLDMVLCGPRDAVYIRPRQVIAMIAVQLGFKPVDIAKHYQWDRSSVYHRVSACYNTGYADRTYRQHANKMAERFGVEGITKYI